MAGVGRERENDKRVFLFPLCLLLFILVEVISASACFAVSVTGQVSRELFSAALSQRRSHHFHGMICFSSWTWHALVSWKKCFSQRWKDWAGVLSVGNYFVFTLCCLLCLNCLKHSKPNPAYSSSNIVNSVLSLFELLLLWIWVDHHVWDASA